MGGGVDRVPLEAARQFADAMLELLSPACERIAIGGSIRRGKPLIGDIELVAVPRMVTVPVGLFDTAEEAATDHVIAELEAGGRVERLSGGDRYVKLRLIPAGLQLDLFLVRPPAQWGVILLIRTGPAEFSEAFVTSVKRDGYHTKDGALHRGRGFGCPKACEVIPTPEEADVFAAVGRPFLAPAARR